MKISILLPYKENFSPEYAGAVSLFVNDTSQLSQYKKNITIYGSTELIKKFKFNYKNLESNKIFDLSKTKAYVDEFINHEKVNKSDLIEIHNRPKYAFIIKKKIETKIVFYFHNDPLTMEGSKTTLERYKLLKICDKLIFNSNWCKRQFLKKLINVKIDDSKILTIRQSTKKSNVKINEKKNYITFVGKLNKAKGYDIFGEAIIKILEKYPQWTAFVIGDEKREKFNFYHKNLKILGFIENKKVINHYKKTSISVTCSRWEEPFGRSSLEASANGCAVIITNRGGLPETITDGIILKKLSVKCLYEAINKLITNKKLLTKYQKLSIKNFYLTNDFIAEKMDSYRSELLSKNFIVNKPTLNKINYKILHITNFNHRFDGRLFYNTGKRINNGLIKLKHNVLELSDRDVTHDNKKISDIDGSKSLNNKILNICNNFKPNLIILGHADKIKVETIVQIKIQDKNVKFAQWFLDPIDEAGPDFIKNKDRFLSKYDLMDANFITTSPDALKFLENKEKCFFIPNPSDEGLDNLKIYKNNCYNDIFFAMSHGVHRGVLKSGKADERYKLLDKINKNKNLITDFYGFNNIQPIWADEFLIKISNSKMGLNLSRGKPVKYYSSDRIAQYMGNGLATLIDEGTQYQDFFDKDELIFYKNTNDLVNKILQYKHDEKSRIKIAIKGSKKYRKYFNSTIVADFIIKKSMNVKSRLKYLWHQK